MAHSSVIGFEICTFLELCIVQYICEQDQPDAHFITSVCFNYTVLCMFRTNKLIFRRLLLYMQHISFSMPGQCYMLHVQK